MVQLVIQLTFDYVDVDDTRFGGGCVTLVLSSVRSPGVEDHQVRDGLVILDDGRDSSPCRSCWQLGRPALPLNAPRPRSCPRTAPRHYAGQIQRASFLDVDILRPEDLRFVGCFQETVSQRH